MTGKGTAGLPTRLGPPLEVERPHEALLHASKTFLLNSSSTPLIFSCGSPWNSKSRLENHFRACRSHGRPYKAALKATARKRMQVTCAVLGDGVPYRA